MQAQPPAESLFRHLLDQVTMNVEAIATEIYLYVSTRTLASSLIVLVAVVADSSTTSIPTMTQWFVRYVCIPVAHTAVVMTDRLSLGPESRPQFT